MGRKVVIDFSAFTTRGKKVIVKELTVIDVESRCVQHMIFKLPRDDASIEETRRHNWMSIHYNGLDFFEGSADYNSMKSTLQYLCMEADFIFAPSHDKASWLESEIFDKSRVVLNLQLFGCNLQSSSSLWFPKDDDKNQCLVHLLRAPGFYCTQSNVKALADWCEGNMESINMDLQCNREKTFTNWPTDKPTPHDIAAQGFVKFTSCEDMTRCVYCGIDLLHWKHDDVPFKDHEKFSPFCDVVMDTYKKKNNDTTQGVDEVGSIDSLCTQCDCDGYPQWRPREDRLNPSA